MVIETIKIPKKFADICTLVRNGQDGAIEMLQSYNGLEHQKMAVLAECAYFEGNFEQGLALSMQICPYLDEWHYGNIRSEQVSAMAFAARILGREDEVIRFFAEQSAKSEADLDLPKHIKERHIRCYQNHTEQIKTGIVPHFTEQETYSSPENPLSLDEIKDYLAERIKTKKDKPYDIESPKGVYSLFLRSARQGNISDAISFYEQIADMEPSLSVSDHILALTCYNYLEDEAKGFKVVLRMALQRLWFVAAATQVRPMDFFRHPSTFRYLNDPIKLKQITLVACGK